MQTPISLKPILAALVVVVTAWIGLAAYTHAAPESGTHVERQMVLSLRNTDDPARMIGARWMEEAVRDITALGGYSVLTIAMISFAAFVGLRRGHRRVRFFLLTTLGGYCCGMLLKAAFNRERPSIVPHLSHVTSSSFPSVHSMMSAIMYLTIGLMLAQELQDRSTRRVLVALPLCLTLLVGISRVFMGVHYPSDVLAGWTAGLLWTCAAFSVNRQLMKQRANPGTFHKESKSGLESHNS